MINIIIADSSVLMAQSLAKFLDLSNQSFKTSIVHDFESFLPLEETINPDFIVCTKDFFKFLDASRTARVSGVIVLSDNVNDHVEYGLQDKNRAYFLQNLSSKNITAHIEEILSRVSDSNNIAPKHDGQILPKYHLEYADLTKREKTVLSYLVQGLSNKEIARYINIQVATVKLHVRGICKKLRASNRTQAVLIAVQNEWNKKQ